MTEYDYSPEAVERHLRKQAGISRWADDTARFPPANPFAPPTPVPGQRDLPRAKSQRRHSSSRRHRSRSPPPPMPTPAPTRERSRSVVAPARPKTAPPRGDVYGQPHPQPYPPPQPQQQQQYYQYYIQPQPGQQTYFILAPPPQQHSPHSPHGHRRAMSYAQQPPSPQYHYPTPAPAQAPMYAPPPRDAVPRREQGLRVRARLRPAAAVPALADDAEGAVSPPARVRARRQGQGPWKEQERRRAAGAAEERYVLGRRVLWTRGRGS
ncbi:hypothetical protein MIND_01284600 [Mycena indigotica]|uniref:Uncharacterized protein n=1 Tax=Mycena indigotica TaxID=2126181 RepID=A0A8H6S4Y6_9AGAR|nr:uncharacterized protein MIND_01284600 [Mycena indigotica]KAF7291400.1 hypothetical protein MIND_01284600 [Mycena indigotica]